MGLTCIYISGIKITTKTLQVNEEKRQLHMVLTHSSIRQNVWVRQPSVHSTSCYKTIWSRKVSHNSHSKLNLYSSAMVVEIPHKCPSTILLCHGYEHPYIAHLLCFLLLLSPLHPTPHPSFFIFHSILLVSAQGLDTERERIIMKLVKTATVWSVIQIHNFFIWTQTCLWHLHWYHTMHNQLYHFPQPLQQFSVSFVISWLTTLTPKKKKSGSPCQYRPVTTSIQPYNIGTGCCTP